MSNNNNYFTPEDDDEDYGFIDFEDDNYDDSDSSDDEYYDSDDEYADSYNDSDDDYSINRNYNKYDSKTSNQKNNSQGLVSFILSEAFSFFKIVAFAAIFALIFTNFIIINAEVPSGSMRDTIWEGDRLFGFRLSYKFSEPERGDIIIFKFPDDESQNYVKRIIGLPNDIVQIKGGRVYINGDELDEPYIKDYIFDDGETYTYIVPEGCYFMLGDNRNNSKDSRYWVNTFVKKEKIIAKVMFRYYSGEKSKIAFSLVK